MAIVFAAVLSELLGPAILLALLIVILVWGARLHRSGRRLDSSNLRFHQTQTRAWRIMGAQARW